MGYQLWMQPQNFPEVIACSSNHFTVFLFPHILCAIIPHLMCQTNQLLRKMQLAKIVYLAAMKLLPLAAIIHQLKLSVNTIGLSNCTFTMDGHRHKELIVYAICSHLQIMILL